MTISIRAIESGGFAVSDGSVTRVVDAAEIRRISNTEVMGAFDRLHTALTDFQNLAEGAGVFGGSGAGAELGSLHANVKAVFASTVTGVGTDLENFGTNLIKGADNWDLADQTSADRSQRLSELVAAGTEGEMAGDQSYRGARDDAGDGLRAGEELSQMQEQLLREQEQAPAETPAADGPPEVPSAGEGDTL